MKRFDFLPGAVGPAMDEALKKLQSQRVIPRIFQRDASLWSAQPDVQESIRRRLGWLSMPSAMAGQLSAIQKTADFCNTHPVKQALLLGMGGSGLFAEVCRQVFGPAANHPDLVVLDTTDPAAILLAQKQAKPAELLAIVASKSGSTIEIASLAKHFEQFFKQHGLSMTSNGLVITDEGTALEEKAKGWGCPYLAHGPSTGIDVGGRFSALTFFGLVPAALLGLDVEMLLKRAQAMARQCQPETALAENPAALLGALLGSCGIQGRNKVTLLSSAPLASVGTWIEQLIAESTGKQGQGLVPVCQEMPKAVSFYGKDRVFIELQLADAVDAKLQSHVDALARAGHPVVRIGWRDRYDLGGDVFAWSLATAIAGFFLGVNPFDEPNVKESKDKTKSLLGVYESSHSLPAEDGLPAASGEALKAFFGALKPSDYIAVLSFLPRTPVLDKATEAIRNIFGAHFGNASVIGIGPRYLHSTGQLFKGGPNTGAFLFLTGDEAEDLAIPGQAYTFGVLKHAQALGDIQAMQSHNRRLLHIHLGANPEKQAQQLLGELKKAFPAKAC